jgi:hypothetical protein
LHQLIVSGLPHEFPPPRTLTTLAERPAGSPHRPRGATQALRLAAAALLALAVAPLLLVPGSAPGEVAQVRPVPAVAGPDVRYTTDADFERGILDGVDTSAGGQLGLTASGRMLRLLWLTRDFDQGHASCTLVKIDSDTGAVRGEYRMVSAGDYCNPDEGWKYALIAVAPDGSAWHARTYDDPEPAVNDANDAGVGAPRDLDHRAFHGRPTQVGLVELGQCDDRNGNGRIETSRGLGDILPWPGRDSEVANATDECILRHLDPSEYGVEGADRFLGVDRRGRLWLEDDGGRYLRFDPATRSADRMDGPMPCDAECRRRHGGRRAVTPNGDTWRGSPNLTPGEGLHHDGAVLSDGETWPTAVVVDQAGKVWIHEGLDDRARRVDPEAGPLACRGTGCGSGRRRGAFDLTVSLPSKHMFGGTSGWMTAERPLPGAASAGTWTVVQDGMTPGRAWGEVSWNGEAPAGVAPDRGLTVDVRAADAIDDLAAQHYASVANGAPLRLTGRFIEVRASFRRSARAGTPFLTDIRIRAAGNASPVAVDNVLTTNRITPGIVSVLWNDSDADGDELRVRNSTNGQHGTVRCTLAGVCTYAPAPGYVGRDSFTYEVSDGRGGADTARVAVTVSRAPIGVVRP